MVLKSKLLLDWSNSKNGTAKLSLTGIVDHNNYLELEDSLKKELSSNKYDMLLVDCRGLDYVNSAGLSILLNLVSNSKEEEEFSVALVGLNSRVKEIVNMLGLDKLFILADTEKEALESKS